MTTTQKLLILLALWVLLKGGIGGAAAPFKTAALTVAIVHDGSDTKNLPAWANDTDANSVDAFVKAHNGEYRIIEQKSNMQFAAEKWQAAMAVPRKSVPWIVAANSRTGFSQPATTEAEAVAALAKMEGK